MFEYCIDASSDEPIMLILKQIGHDRDEHGNITNYGIDGEQFCRELMLLDAMGKSRIQVWINSIGGSVIDGYSILAAILKSKTKIDTCNIGVAASTAGWLFQAGRKREMMDYAFFMGHNPEGGGEENAEVREKFRNGIIKIISERTGKDEGWVSNMLNRETYMDAETCKAENFCDDVTPTGSQNKKRMAAALTVTDKHKEALLIVNKLLPGKKETTMADTIKFPAIVNRLNANRADADKLHEAASEQMVVEAIDAIQNKLTVTESNLALEKKAVEVANKANADLQNRYDVLEAEMKTIKDKMAADEVANRLKEATEMVNGFVEMGKVENKEESIQPWIDLAKVDKAGFDRVKNMLTALPVNKESAKIEVKTLTGTGGPKNFAQRMHEIAVKNKIK